VGFPICRPIGLDSRPRCRVAGVPGAAADPVFRKGENFVTDATVLRALVPVILLLAFGVAAAILSRAMRLSPIVGYLLLGILLQLSGAAVLVDTHTVAVLAELGVVFLLFDIGLHFSLTHVREHVRDIFGFGPLQVLFGAMPLALLALVMGSAPAPAVLVGAILALSSTAVVAPLIAERRQQNCPVGLTATAILVFQDVAAIFLLIIAGSLSGGAVLPVAAGALAKAGMAFMVAVLLARFAVKPLFRQIARAGQEEVFTATALLIALAAGWATGHIGLSLTLGAFLGGMSIAETPYRAVIQAEIKPFRGLLLGFFFIAVGLSLDVGALIRQWPAIIGVAVAMVLVKILTNACASLVFRWSVPGSLQLGFLLAQGSEFAFVILSLPAVRALVGPTKVSVLVAAVALSLAVTPNLAEVGRRVAGRLRRQAAKQHDPELLRQGTAAPVLIVGMGHAGRTLADGLHAFDIGYSAVERDPRRLSEAIADGYAVVFGDMADPRIWSSLAAPGRRINAFTGVTLDMARDLMPLGLRLYPDLLRFAVVADAAEAEQFEELGMRAVLDGGGPPGLAFAAAVLGELGIPEAALQDWAHRQRHRMMLGSGEAFVAA
jgi:Kef-type K+ transport system membrane component KefB